MAERQAETITALSAGQNPSIIRFAIHLTSVCNMRCSYCKESKLGNLFMDRELFTQLCQRAGKDGIVHITGGEPLICPWLEDELDNMRGSTRFALNTNLLKMPREKTLAAIFRLKTSLDDYDEVRWNKLIGGNYFKKVVEHIKLASQVVPYTSVCYTATHQNAARLPEFLSFAETAFPNLYLLAVSFYKGTNSNLVLTPTDVELLFKASELMDNISQKVFLSTHSIQGNYFPGNLTIPCYLSLTERLYDECGKEYYCSHLYRDKVEPPGRPGLDPHCVTGCNARFHQFNREIHQALKGIK